MIREIAARARSLWRGIRHRDRLAAEMDAEFHAHMQLRADDLTRAGLSPADAARQARLEFGSTGHYKDKGSESRGLRTFDGLRISLLDLKLGVRMLAKYPGLTIVGGIAIAFAVAVGAATFEFVTQYLSPRLAMPDGNRIELIKLWDASANRSERRVMHDVIRWRRELHSVEELGAVRSIDRNLLTTGAAVGEPVIAAEISAATLRLAGARPILGRSLTDADEATGAPSVVVIGFNVWQRRFGGDSSIVGRTVRLGSMAHTVVGVMPEGFAFPIFHDLWLPLRLDDLAAQAASGRGPELSAVIARLAPGVTVAAAQAELAAVALRGATPADAYTTLRPIIAPYARALADATGEGGLLLFAMNTFLVMLLVLIFANVALLVFARAATRESEIVVRSALGASRGRIVMQLFAEALVLGGVAALAGLMLAALAWRWALGVFARAQGGRLPFWFHYDLSPTTLVYAALLVLLCALVAGVVPGLKATRGIESRLRRAAAGAGTLQLGGLWTAVIVAQIAVTVAFPVTAFFSWRDAKQVQSLHLGVRPSEYLTARLRMDLERVADERGDVSRAALSSRFQATARTLEERAELEPGVFAVTFASLLPGMDHPQRAIDIDGEVAQADSNEGPRVSSALVATDYFDALAAPVVSGRGFIAADLDTSQRAVVVNQTFARQILGGRNPIGRRVRYVPRRNDDEDLSRAEQRRRWFTIVGVVKDLGMTDGSNPRETGAGIYHPVAPGSSGTLYMLARVRGDPHALGPRVRALAAVTDPTLRLDEMLALDEVQAANIEATMFFFRVLVGVTAIALLLSLAGIYAVMAFTVARRTREIGVRVALGSDAWRIFTTTFARPLKQVGLGVLAGGVLVTVLVRLVLESLTALEAGAIIGYAATMLGVCLLACVVPTRRALRIQPTEALRADG